ncbi:SpaA isopeptide-forming pilin-related protein [Vagococcus luciliae]|uniref:Collagen-binding protein n=1 Tax=Vagococcus luciliae TaxID=2920380 RepID=A0ABY5NXP9_9ENTE|nr:SpaA isopeptide-forming pilin-related protein [Vagococcus luciliae]UUV98211.1 hypothetical protein G314FT_03030 [Vagococcus luciliae]
MKKSIIRVWMIFVTLFLFCMGIVTVASGQSFPEGGDIYSDLGPNLGELGIASKFHAFAENSVEIGAHVNGNIACNNFYANSNFGTDIREGTLNQEIVYLNKVHSIVSSSFINENDQRSTKFVVGKDNKLDIVDNGRYVSLNGIKLDHVPISSIYQDHNKEYIDFQYEFNRLEQKASYFYTLSKIFLDNNSFEDKNIRKFIVPEIKEDTVFINIKSELLESNTPFQIINPYNKLVIINVTGEVNKLNVLSKIEYNNRSNHETEDFSDANLIWNFGNNITGLNIEAPFLGTVLAPKADINVDKNLDGSIIGKNIKINSETHRWDPNPIFPIFGAVRLIKEDGLTHEVLSGAKFSLYTAAGEEVASELTTNAKGILNYEGLSVGSYYFVETQAPEGYELDTSPQRFAIKAGETSEVTEMKMSNQKTAEERGAVRLIKEDGLTHEVLSGAKFSLYTAAGEEVASELTTNAKGILNYEGLSVGSYYFVETQAPEGYELDTSPQRFAIKAGETSEVTEMKMSNQKTAEERGAVRLIKEDGLTHEVLSGAKFSLYTAAGEEVASELTTNAKGILNYEGLSVGSYYFVETQAPEGYELDTSPQRFAIKAGETSEVTEMKMSNQKTAEERGAVRLIKEDGLTHEVLSGAKFSLYTAAGEEVASELTTNAKGILNYEGLSVGSYYFVETQAPEGYELDTSPQRFAIKAGETSEVTEMKMSNQKTAEERGAVRLIKEDGLTHEVLSGAKFSLYTAAGEEVASELTTNAKGILNYEGLSVGSYYFVETQAPEGYELDTSPQRFAIKAGETSEVTEMKMSNQKTAEERGAVRLIKEDGLTHEVLSGAKFSLYTAAGEEVASELTTNAKGILNYEGLSVGSYYFVETQAPEGYELDTSPQRFAIKAGETSEVTEMKMSNQKTAEERGAVRLIKEDGLTHEVLSGAKFSLYTAAGEEVASELTTNAKGILNYEGLSVGSYYFVETQAPEGYELDTSPQRFAIKAGETSEVTEMKMSNQKTADRIIVKDKKNIRRQLPKTGDKFDIELIYIGFLLLLSCVMLFCLN